MSVRFFSFVTFIFLLIGCSSQPDENNDYSNTPVLTYNLLKVCLDKTMGTYAESNTERYVLDLSKIETLDKTGVDNFLAGNPSIVPVLQDDSSKVIKSIQDAGVKILENIVVRIEEVEYIDKSHVYVIISKVRSRNQIITLSLDLRRQGETYKIFKSETKR